MNEESNSQKTKALLQQIVTAILKGDGMPERYHIHSIYHFNDIGARVAFVRFGDQGEETTEMVIEVAPTAHSRPVRMLPFEFIERRRGLDTLMDDEGEPLSPESDTLEYRVKWLLLQYAATQFTTNHKHCGLPAHTLLAGHPYHHEYAIQLEETGEIVSFRFLL